MSRINELALAAQDACNASCKRHRDRAMIRLRTAVEAVGFDGARREKLITDLVAFVKDWEGEDPEADALVARCKEVGL